MKKRLIIAEKPSMGQSIANALSTKQKRGDGFIETENGVVTWCVGHIMRSYTPEEYKPEWSKWELGLLPMLPKEWLIKTDSSKSKQFSVIKKLLAECDTVINAGDPGREGQLIVDEVLFYLKNKKPVERLLLYALDVKSVEQAFSKLEDNTKYYNLYLAGVCRGYADWLMGMNATRAYTLQAQKSGYKGVLSVGRVQSPTLSIVVNRDLEIENFKPKDYSLIYGLFDKGGSIFKAYWKPNEGSGVELDEDGRVINKDQAKNIVDKITGKDAVVVSYEEKEGKENAPLPFNLSKLQIYANSKWGMSIKKVLDVCQSLYETHKLQSYPRTDCQYLPENQFNDADEIINNIGESFNDLVMVAKNADRSIKSAAWNDKKLGEHYGLIPTKKKANLSELTQDEVRIYRAVCEAYMAQFYPASEYLSASVELDCEGESFKATGKTVTLMGWKSIFSDESDVDDNNEDQQVFPLLSNGDKLRCDKGVSEDKKTTPPARFNQGSLVKSMINIHTLVKDPEMKRILKDKKGIGRDATRAQIIESLFKRGLLETKGKQVLSTEAGRALIKALPTSVVNPVLTAMWEDALDKIAEGKLSVDKFKENQVAWVTKLIGEAKETTIGSIEVKGGVSKKGGSKSKDRGKCPKCGTGVLYENITKTKKKVIGCSNWNKDPKCDYVKWL